MPIKANRQVLLDDIRILDWSTTPFRTTVGKGHGHLKQRTCAVVPFGPTHQHVAELPGRRQAFRIVRRRTVLKADKTIEETVHGLTPLPPQRAGPSEILILNRGHWEIENRLHYVRDFSFDEDRSRIRKGKLPRNLAASPTPPSPSCAYTDASSTSHRRTATTSLGRPTPCATSSPRLPEGRPPQSSAGQESPGHSFGFSCRLAFTVALNASRCPSIRPSLPK